MTEVIECIFSFFVTKHCSVTINCLIQHLTMRCDRSLNYHKSESYEKSQLASTIEPKQPQKDCWRSYKTRLYLLREKMLGDFRAKATLSQIKYSKYNCSNLRTGLSQIDCRVRRNSKFLAEAKLSRQINI